MNDEVPDDDDFDAGRQRGEFDRITPEDFIRGAGGGNPPGWLSGERIDQVRGEMPVPYIEVVPVRCDQLGRVTEVGSLLRVRENGSVERTLITGRILFHETIREALARNIGKDLGELVLPTLPVDLTPFTVAEFFPTPGISEFYDPRQHAIALCYVVQISGDCKPVDSTLDVEWCGVESDRFDTFIGQMADGHDRIVRRALAWVGA